MPIYNNNFNNRGGNDRRGGFQSQQRQEEPAYTVAHPVKSEWFTIGADSELVKYAELAGLDLKNGGLTNSKIRSIYGEVKRIQMGTFGKNKSAFYLLKPKVAYAYGRDKNKGLKIFKDIFDASVKYVNDDKSYDNFCNFMEAILAYHRANGGK